MNLQALQDCLIVEPDLEKHELFALLQQKQTGFGTVLKAGPEATIVKVGDKVCFGDSIGQEFLHENHQYLVMREAHVLGVLEA